MAYEQRPNTGSLFKNDRKESDTHADYKGSAMIAGAEMWVDAWINTTSDGRKYMSLKFKAKESRTDSFAQQAAMRGSVTPADLDDDVPF